MKYLLASSDLYYSKISSTICDSILIVPFVLSANENETSITNTKKCDRIVICDPTHNEEAIMDGKLVLGINPYKEICTLHLAGQMIIDKVIF